MTMFVIVGIAKGKKVMIGITGTVLILAVCGLTFALTARYYIKEINTETALAYDRGVQDQYKENNEFLSWGVDFGKVPVKGNENFFVLVELKFFDGGLDSKEIIMTFDHYPVFEKE